MPEALRQRVAAYLREHHVMTLATYGSEGLWAAAVFYVDDGHNLFFLSSPTSRHCRNLAKSPRVSATIQKDYVDWPDIKGVQLEGIAREIRGKEEARARRLYGEKFPVIRGLARAPAALAEAMDRVRWYEVAPDRLYFIDNSAGFGHRDAIDLRRNP
jgi:hypothetical protein